MTPDELLAEALASKHPGTAVHELAKQLKNDGMKKDEMYELFSRLLKTIDQDEDEIRYDALTDTMDLIVGWCCQANALFP